MTDLVGYRLPSGGTMYLRVATDQSAVRSHGVDIDIAHETFKDSISSVTETADVIIESLKSSSPSSIDVEFTVGVSGKIGLFLGSTEVEGAFKVRLAWDKDD